MTLLWCLEALTHQIWNLMAALVPSCACTQSCTAIPAHLGGSLHRTRSCLVVSTMSSRAKDVGITVSPRSKPRPGSATTDIPNGVGLPLASPQPGSRHYGHPQRCWPGGSLARPGVLSSSRTSPTAPSRQPGSRYDQRHNHSSSVSDSGKDNGTANHVSAGDFGWISTMRTNASGMRTWPGTVLPQVAHDRGVEDLTLLARVSATLFPAC